MKLSEAIMLGDTLKKPNAYTFLSLDGSCGCAFGGAILAAGVQNEFIAAAYGGECRDMNDLIPEMECVQRLWPWLTAGHIAKISDAYFGVKNGSKTLEQLCDYVRSIEPAEPSISILPSRKPLVRIPEGSDQGDEQPEWDDTDTSRELYSGIQRGCQ